jgi:hypothetical protein
MELIYPKVKINKKTMSDEDINEYKFDASNLSYILACASKEMVVSYMNNIKLNFFKYICQFVNQSFKEEHEKLIEECTDNKSKLKKQLKGELRKVKDDLILCTQNCDEKYHEWIKKFKHKILPKDFKKSYECDVKHYPNKYTKYMLFMNNYLEKSNLKTFQPISLRTDIKNKYITLNTNAIVDIIPKLGNKKYYNDNIYKLQKDIWNMLFVMKGSKFKMKNYSFNYQIQTDGFAVSINYIHKNEIIKKRDISKKRMNASKKGKQNNKNKTIEKIINEKEIKKEKQIQKSIEINEKYKQIAKQKREEFKKLPKDEQERIKLQIKLNNNEFNYIGNLVKCTEFLKFIKEKHNDKNLVYGDPGKRSPLMLLGDNGEYFEYKTKGRLRETKRLKYNKLIDSKKYATNLPTIKKTIKEAELKLCDYSGKTTNIKIFKKYIQLKIALRNDIPNKYNNYLQKLKWFAYINKRRHEDNLLNELEDTYGKDAIFVLGDWGNKGRLSYISTPNVGLKRKLLERFNVYHIDEYKTSAINYKTKTRCKNLKIRTKNGSLKIHSVLTYKMSKGRLGCINRDVNAVNNMKIIVDSLIKTQKRPIEYSRTKKRNPENPCSKQCQFSEATPVA